MTLTTERRDDLFVFDDRTRTTGPPEAKRRIRHVPALDGLRGVAVLAVVLFHFEFTISGRYVAKGGFLGVDAFFVLSGYLITNLLLSEWADTSAVNLREFWTRRARRLFPALAITLAVMCVFVTFVAIPDVRAQLRGQMLATMFYVTNWNFILSGESYVEQFTYPSPLRHMWSLAIEEQFYLLWPIVVAVVLRWRRDARVVMWTALALAVASTVWMALLFQPDTDPSRVYYGTDTRLQSLTLGAALAAALAAGITVRGAVARKTLGWVAVAASAWLALTWSRTNYVDPWLYTGGFLLLALAVCIVILACVEGTDPGRENPVAAALSWMPLRWLGLISYGVYLYHWPVFVYFNAERLGIEGFPLLFARLAITLTFAIPSYLFVERPIRQGTVLGRVGFRPAHLPIVAVVLLAGILLSTMDARATMFLGDPIEGRPIETAPANEAAGARPAVPRVMFAGDSVAYSIATGFAKGTGNENLIVAQNQAVLWCEFAPGNRLELTGEAFPRKGECDEWQKIWGSSKQRFRPQMIVFGFGVWEVFDRVVDGQTTVFGQSESDRQIRQTLDTLVRELSDRNTTLVFLTNPTLAGDSNRSPEWRSDQQWRVAHINDLLRDVAAKVPDRVKVLDLASYVCPAPDRCQTELDGVVLRPDGVHYENPDKVPPGTKVGASVLAPWLAEQLLTIYRSGGPTDPPLTESSTTGSGTAPVPTTASGAP